MNKNIILIILATAFILLIPLVAMQFTDEVNWTLADFLVAGTLLLATGFAFEFISRKLTATKQRAILAIALGLALVIVWTDLAVGIFNIPGFSGS
jgi:hypothetical protein